MGYPFDVCSRARNLPRSQKQVFSQILAFCDALACLGRGGGGGGGGCDQPKEWMEAGKESGLAGALGF